MNYECIRDFSLIVLRCGGLFFVGLEVMLCFVCFGGDGVALLCALLWGLLSWFLLVFLLSGYL